MSAWCGKPASQLSTHESPLSWPTRNPESRMAASADCWKIPALQEAPPKGTPRIIARETVLPIAGCKAQLGAAASGIFRFQNKGQ